jgi:hypothetical protein
MRWVNARGAHRRQPLVPLLCRRQRPQPHQAASASSYLAPSYKKDPPPDTNTPGLTNLYIQGILWRETWERLDPNGTGPNFSWLDDAISKSESHSKLSSLEILPGSFAPDWFFALPGAVTFNTVAYGRTTVPWDPVFQSEWEKLNKALAARYDGRIAYVKLIVPGTARNPIS